ncbi:MAG: hypothetical protein ACPGYL_15720, partial [Rhodospirillaceae bacterium]
KTVIKILVMVLLVLVIIAGGIAGAIKMGFIDDFIGLGEHMQPSIPEPTVADILGPPPELINLRPFEIPIIINGRLNRNVNLRIRLKLREDGIAELQTQAEHLHGNLYRELASFLPYHLETRDRIELRVLKTRLLRTAKRSLEDPDLVEEVLIQGIFER